MVLATRRGRVSRDRPRRKRWTGRVEIDLVELQRMHHVVGQVVKLNALGPGSTAYSLLASLGSCLGHWPRVRRATVADVRKRYQVLLAELDER
jgi:hypothetical protein